MRNDPSGAIMVTEMTHSNQARMFLNCKGSLPIQVFRDRLPRFRARGFDRFECPSCGLRIETSPVFRLVAPRVTGVGTGGNIAQRV